MNASRSIRAGGFWLLVVMVGGAGIAGAQMPGIPQMPTPQPAPMPSPQMPSMPTGTGYVPIVAAGAGYVPIVFSIVFGIGGVPGEWGSGGGFHGGVVRGRRSFEAGVDQ